MDSRANARAYREGTQREQEGIYTLSTVIMASTTLYHYGLFLCGFFLGRVEDAWFTFSSGGSGGTR